jgi:streptogramin lyase
MFALLLLFTFLLARSEAAVIVEWGAPAESKPWELVADHANQVWFVKSYGNGVCRLHPNTGTLLEFTLSGVSPWGISADTDEKRGPWIYFTDLLSPKIYRVDARGGGAGFDVFTLDSGGGYASQLKGIHVQNSTRIWFASPGTHRVGLLNLTYTSSPPSYNVTYWSTPNDCTPLSLVYDEGSGLWFTDNTGDSVGNIPNPEANVIYFYHLRGGSAPADIDVDLFGNIWFTESGSNRVGRINPRLNEVTEYLIPIPNSNPYGVAVDYSNRVWITLRNENAIALFNPDTNTFSLYWRPGLGEPTFIATSKDRRTPVFFTDSLGNKIGKIDPNLEVTTVVGGSLSTASMSRTTGSSTTILSEGKTTGKFMDIHLSASKAAEKKEWQGATTTYTAPETLTLVRTSTSDVTTYYVTQTATTFTTVLGTYTSYIATTTDVLTTVRYDTSTSYVTTKTGTLTTYRTLTTYTTGLTSPSTGVLIVPGYQASSILLGLMAGSTVLLCWRTLKDRLKRGKVG